MNEFFMIAGVILMIVGGLWVIVEAFRDGLLWGLGCLLLPFLQLIYIATHWEETKKPFFVALAGAALLVLSALKTAT